ncbi:GIY-YIG catalytic domain protein [uncultured archaeon]|nr:GIY-YIG catalytic domain protein [uncultured archaeon]
MITIYKITNCANGKIYVGKTKHDIARRWRWHLTSARMGVSTHLYSAIRKYGAETFSITELQCVEPELANICESFWIAELESMSSAGGYNMTPGGDGTSNPSDEVRKKMSEAAKKHWQDGVYPRKRPGKKMPESFRRKHSARWKGDGNPRFKNNSPLPASQKLAISRGLLKAWAEGRRGK